MTKEIIIFIIVVSLTLSNTIQGYMSPAKSRDVLRPMATRNGGYGRWLDMKTGQVANQMWIDDGSPDHETIDRHRARLLEAQNRLNAWLNGNGEQPVDLTAEDREILRHHGKSPAEIAVANSRLGEAAFALALMRELRPSSMQEIINLMITFKCPFVASKHGGCRLCIAGPLRKKYGNTDIDISLIKSRLRQLRGFSVVRLAG
ncbi:hypothetical protein ACFL0T_08560, partial [Candidatus Omnitrophota bacterium]